MPEVAQKMKGEDLDVKDWLATAMDRGKLGIQCPDRDCGGKAVVNRKRWLESKPDYATRSCTYCFKTFKVPDKLRKGAR